MRITDERRAGFTLLEALVALTILAGTTASLMMLIATNRRAQADADADLSVALHARTLLARIGRDLPLEIGTISGTFEDGRTWSILATPFGPEPATPNSTLLQVKVRLQRMVSKPSLIEVVTLKRTPR
ncbi:PulJ/GspJ family protein [Microvirga brassicacearum]|uniref:Type II secretion system protein n=1 Tax=Microvirga brassicacearum TaxID=2580413 RepID=A0A5N3P4P2_9HYPH|nr:type II secretion system protein [Microvirga brassicacearum]KAB0264673.1 type II secretion system protein [Microvirga brassicacearum]